MLTDLYCLICKACNYYLFSTDDPFRSIGCEQPKFFELVKETMPVLQGLKEYDNKRYDLKEKINELCLMILMLTISLSEPEKGIEYYFKNSQESRREITLYRALDTVRWIGDDGLWIQVYEYGIKKKIKPRDSLRAAYEAKKNPN